MVRILCLETNKIGGIGHKIGIGVKVTEGCVATTEVVSWTAGSKLLKETIKL